MKLKVYRRTTLLWTFPDVTEAFAMGYAYASMFGNDHRPLEAQYESKTFIDDSGIHAWYLRVRGMARDVEDLGVTTYDTYEQYQLSNKLTEELARPGAYNYWIHDDDPYDIKFVIDNDFEFYRGLSVGARDTERPIESIILTWPYKDGQWYDIPGLNLKYPDAFNREVIR